MHGYHGRILHVNLTNGQTHIETFDETCCRTSAAPGSTRAGGGAWGATASPTAEAGAPGG